MAGAHETNTGRVETKMKTETKIEAIERKQNEDLYPKDRLVSYQTAVAIYKAAGRK